MNVENLYRAIGTVDGDLLERCETAVRRGGAKSNWLKWAGAVACFGLIVTVAMAALPGILKEVNFERARWSCVASLL